MLVPGRLRKLLQGKPVEHPRDWRRGLHWQSRLQSAGAKGYIPITYDNLSRGNVWAVKWGPSSKATLPMRSSFAPYSTIISHVR